MNFTHGISAVIRLDTKTGRAKLAARPAPYFAKLSKGRYLGLRVLKGGAATWVARYRTEELEQQHRTLGELAESFEYDHAKVAAESWFRELDGGETGLSDDGTPKTVEAACREYVDDRRRQKGDTAANEAARRFERELYGGGGKDGKRYAAHTLAAVPLAKLRARTLEQWRDGLVTGGLSKASANRTLTTLKAALNCAVRHRYVGSEVAIEWRSVRPYAGANRRRDLSLDLAQRRALLQAAKGALHNLIAAAVHTGARAGELTSAKRSQFDARTNSLTLIGRSGSRTIPLSPAAVEVFKKLAEGKLPAAHLLTRDDGEPWAHSDWDELVRDAASAAKLPKGTCLYTLRHSWITAAITHGMSALEVARLVGTNLATIDKNYGHLAQSAARERLSKVVMV